MGVLDVGNVPVTAYAVIFCPTGRREGENRPSVEVYEGCLDPREVDRRKRVSRENLIDVVGTLLETKSLDLASWYFLRDCDPCELSACLQASIKHYALPFRPEHPNHRDTLRYQYRKEERCSICLDCLILQASKDPGILSQIAEQAIQRIHKHWSHRPHG